MTTRKHTFGLDGGEVEEEATDWPTFYERRGVALIRARMMARSGHTVGRSDFDPDLLRITEPSADSSASLRVPSILIPLLERLDLR